VHARFYASDAREIGQVVALPADEAAHATRVMRLHAGDAVRVFDGAGREFAGEIEQATKLGVQVRLQQRHEPAPERRTHVTLVPAVLKGDKMDDVVRDAVMMGVTSIVPIVSARSETSLATLERGHRRERWERIAIVSAKQCGRAVVPTIEEPCEFATLHERLSSMVAHSAFMLVEPDQGSGNGNQGSRAADFGDTASPAVVVIVGPEGGWSPDEVAAMTKLARPVTLPGPTLRADAMPIVALSVLYARWGEL
jgi:16S rRNA (uracil1498-N3)-methyltransferase